MTMHNFDDSELSRRIDEIIQAHADDPEPCIDEIVAEVLWHHGDLVEKHKYELAEARIRAIESGSVLDELPPGDDDPYEDDPEMLRKRIELNTAKLRAAEEFYAKLKPIFAKHPGITTGEAVALFNQQQEQAGQAG